MEHKHTRDGACEHCGLVPLVDLVRKQARVIAESEAMRDTLRRASRFAASDAPVAVFGESGTGKEVVARVLHANSPRALQPFVAINVAALPAELLESELFGHARGAFTGAHKERRGLLEEAHGGTLFLDEIGEMPLPLQAKLLRALQDGEIRRVGAAHSFAVDVRVVSATHRDLSALVRSGGFREDLLYRLKVLTLRVPPLRERPEDILVLARHFLASEKGAAKAFSRAAERALARYGWPGNVRELASAIKHGAALASGPQIEPEHLPEEVVRTEAAQRPSSKAPRGLKTLAEVEREHILSVLEACGGSVADAARALDIGRNTLWRKLKQYE